MAEVLKVRELRKSFGANQIIRGLDLTVQAGERHAVIGPNGAGKSTLFNLVTGYLRPDGGEITLKGRSIGGLPPHQVSRAGLSRSFQITTVFAQLSVFENLRVAAMARHNTRFPLFRLANRAKAINRDAEDLLEQVRLTALADRLAGGLTYAEQRALEIGMALGPGSDLILLDEPTAGMSREETNYIISLIRTVSAGKTLIVIEHDMDVVFKLCDRISVLVYGEIIASDAPEAIRANDKVQQAYLGEAHA
jgi:branched-chain amino acid transport system ATP-binding protein